MDIEIFVAPNGHIAFTCHGEFTKKVSEVILNADTGIVKFIFDPDNQEIEMNCTIHEEICDKIKNQLFCVLGYFIDKKLIASEYVRFSCIF